MILLKTILPILMIFVHLVRYGAIKPKPNIIIYFYFGLYPFVISNHTIEAYITVNNEVIIFGIVLFFIHAMVTKRTRFTLNPQMLLLLVPFVLSFMNSTDSHQFTSGMTNFLYVVVAYFYLSNAIETEVFPVILRIFAFNGIILSLYGVAEYGLTQQRIIGTFSNPNQLSIYLLISFICLVMMKEKKVWIFLVGFCIFLTGSRAAILGMPIPFLLTLQLKPKHLFFLSATLIVAIMAAQFTGIFDRFQQVSSGHQDIVERLSIFKVATEMFKDHPIIGIGYNNYITTFAYYYPDLDVAMSRDVIPSHNDFVKIITETGLIGFLAFMIYLIKCFKDIKKTEDENLKKVFMAIFLSILIYSFFHNFTQAVDFWLFTSLATIYKFSPKIRVARHAVSKTI